MLKTVSLLVTVVFCIALIPVSFYKNTNIQDVYSLWFLEMLYRKLTQIV
jgi:hypothetical protein